MTYAKFVGKEPIENEILEIQKTRKKINKRWNIAEKRRGA